MSEEAYTEVADTVADSNGAEESPRSMLVTFAVTAFVIGVIMILFALNSPHAAQRPF